MSLMEWHINTLTVQINKKKQMQYTYKVFTIKAPERFQYNFNLFYPFMAYTFYTNTDVHSQRMTHKGSKHVGVLVP